MDRGRVDTNPMTSIKRLVILAPFTIPTSQEQNYKYYNRYILHKLPYYIIDSQLANSANISSTSLPFHSQYHSV